MILVMYKKNLSFIFIFILVSSVIASSSFTQIGYGSNGTQSSPNNIPSSSYSANTNSSTTTSNGNSNNNGTITLVTFSVSPVSGATYIIKPNPKTGSGSLTVTDGGVGDEDGLANGIIKISQVPMGKYGIGQVNIPPGYLSLLKHTVRNVAPSHMNQMIKFPVVSKSTDLTQLSSDSIPAPSLSNKVFNKWKSSYFASIVSNTNSRTLVTNVDQTPQIILAGSRNSSAINVSEISDSSLLLNTSFAPLTNGSTIVNTIGLDNYSLPNSTNVVAVIPTIVTNVSTTSGYMVSTPPVSEVIPGQEMIISVANPLIPNFGGLKSITVQSSISKSSSANNTNWFVAEVENKIPSTISSKGIKDKPILFVNIQHPFEENKTAFNWSNASNFAKSPTLTIIVNKNSSSSIQNDSAGCPMINSYTRFSGSWTTLGVSEISSKSISPSKCEIIIQSQHLSKFAFSLDHLISLIPNFGPSGISQTTTTTLTSSATPSVFGKSVTFTAAVTSFGGTPTGTVTFKDGTTIIGSATLSSGKAVLTTYSLSVRSHSITAAYGANTNYSTSTSLTLIQTVKAS
ncbi:Bacterial Ig-like domain (group 3) [uncultured archaeon]|nr:Bacterial Ig-like domain (group 3) [uncultured archaeon]